MSESLKPVCVLGATGFLGSAIIEELERISVPWVGVSTRIATPKIKLVSRNDLVSLISVFSECDSVINAAGSLKPKDFEANPIAALSNYWEMQEHISEAIKQSNIETVVHISSAGTVYGEGSLTRKHIEDDCTTPISWYGRAKVFEELWYADLCKRLNIRHLCTRVSNPFGNKKKSSHGFIDVLLNAATNNHPFSTYKDCDPLRDFIYAKDMANIIMNLMLGKAEGYFNVASGVSTRLSEIIKYVQEKSRKPLIINKNLERPSYDVLISNISTEKIKTQGAYKSTITVFDYIDSLYGSIHNREVYESIS